MGGMGGMGGMLWVCLCCSGDSASPISILCLSELRAESGKWVFSSFVCLIVNTRFLGEPLLPDSAFQTDMNIEFKLSGENVMRNPNGRVGICFLLNV